MSNLKVGIGLTLDGATGNICGGVGIVTATGVSISQINDGQIGGNRNLIINGAMQVAQRATSSTGATAYETVDRFACTFTNVDETPTQAQHALTSSDTGPWAKGFRSSLHLTNGNQTGGAGTSDRILVAQYVESQNIANSGWDYNNTSSYITLSFWVKSSIAQNFYGYLMSDDATQQTYPYETGSLSANTWTKITKTIPGNSNLTFNNDTGAGLRIYLAPFMGTDYTASVTLNAWAAYASGTRMPDNTSTWYTTNDSTFEITGVQLEVGSVATPFEHRSYGDELSRCQRYLATWGYNALYAVGRANGTADFVFTPSLNVPLRVSPSITQSIDSGLWKVFRHNGASTGTNTPTVRRWVKDAPCITLTLDGFSSLVDDHVGTIQANFGSNGYFWLSAEL